MKEEKRMVKIKNYTPHDINIIEGAVYDEKRRKYVGGKIVATFPSVGVLSAALETCYTEPLDTPCGKIPCVTNKYTGVAIPPSEEPDTYIIVSALYLNACKKAGIDTSRMLTVSSTVQNEFGATIGTVALCRTKGE